MATQTYELRAVDSSPSGLREIHGLLQQVWPNANKFSLDYLTWLYRDNPSGAAVGFNAFLGQDLVAHYATIPIEAELSATKQSGLLSLNTATHPQHQGKGLFTQLAEKTFESGATAGKTFVVGVANSNSTPGFTRKLGFELVAPLDVKVGVGHCPSSRSTVSPSFRRLWSEDALRWRLGAPGANYCARADGSSWTVESATAYPFIRAVMTRIEGTARPAPLQQLPVRGLAPVVWLGLDHSIDWRLRPFVTLPNRLRPSPLNLIFRSLKSPAFSLDPRTVRFEALDFDPY